MWAPSWNWVLVANVLLGVSQGLTWSTTVIMKIDLAGPRTRGLAMGLNEFAGYFAVALAARSRPAAIAAHYGLRPEPFYLGVAFVASACCSPSCRRARDASTTSATRRSSTATHAAPSGRSRRGLLATTLPRPRTVERQPGRPRQQPQRRHGVGPVPAVLRRAEDWTSGRSASLAAIYPADWGIAQLFTGAWSDRVGRKWLIAAGMWVQAVGIASSSLSRRLRRLRGRRRAARASAPRWSTRRCSRRSATSRIRRGARRRSASTGSGATSATRSARCSPASPPTRSALARDVARRGAHVRLGARRRRPDARDATPSRGDGTMTR